MGTDQVSTIDKITAAAERRMRSSGFHGFSFREIAADVGITSASVHHHFPTKEELGASVAKAYTDRFMAALGDADDPGRRPAELLQHYVGLFRHALFNDGQMCLCGVLGAERSGLPDVVKYEAKRFFELNLAWLEAVLRRQKRRLTQERVHSEALRILATLEGAMLAANALDDSTVFERIAGVVASAPN